MVPLERALVSSYRPSLVTFPLSLRVSEILPLLCSSTLLFLTPPLVSPKFSYGPLGVGGWPLAILDLADVNFDFFDGETASGTSFLPRDASAERGYEIAFVCPSVCLAVCLSVRL